jgi:hypothetical protein
LKRGPLWTACCWPSWLEHYRAWRCILM